MSFEKGKIHTFVGTGEKGYTGEGGPAKKAKLSGPKGISVGPNGGVSGDVIELARALLASLDLPHTSPRPAAVEV